MVSKVRKRIFRDFFDTLRQILINYKLKISITAEVWKNRRVRTKNMLVLKAYS